MVENTKIEWADHTFNPWVGCTKVSPACDHCYAESWAKRTGDPQLWQGARRRTSKANWRKPLQWNEEAKAAGTRPRVFCASLADIFDNQVPDEWRADLWDLIELTPNLTWLLLTKRISNAWRMQRCSGWFEAQRNVWLGITVCNQEEADRDIPKLMNFNARQRFLSIEPMLGEVDLSRFMPPIAMMQPEVAPATWTEWNERSLWPSWVPETWQKNIEGFWGCSIGRGPRAWLRDAIEQHAAPHGATMGTTHAIGERGKTVNGRFVHTWNNMCILVDEAGAVHVTSTPRPGLLGPSPASSTYQHLHWVIAGGESGGNARPAHPAWFRQLRDQCVAAGVPFLFKQWGNWLPGECIPGGDLGGDIRAGRAQFVSPVPHDGLGHLPPSTQLMRRFDKKVAGRELDGRTWDQFPEIAA